MSNIKPSDHGIVVEGKESGVRYAVSDVNYDPQTERKIRDLKPGETVLSYQPKATGNGTSQDSGGDREDLEDPDTLDGLSGDGK